MEQSVRPCFDRVTEELRSNAGVAPAIGIDTVIQVVEAKLNKLRRLGISNRRRAGPGDKLVHRNIDLLRRFSRHKLKRAGWV